MKIQFSLRTFLIVVALVGVILLPVANFVYQVKSQVRRQKLAMAKLEDAGAMIVWARRLGTAKDRVRYADEKASWLVRLARDYIDPTAYDPRPEVGLNKRPSMLDVETCEKQLALVRDLHQVERLGLQVERVTGAMMEQVAALPDLHSLTLHCKTIDPEAVSRFAELAQIEELVLETPLNDAIASAVEQMRGLTTLSIRPTGLSPESAAKLGNCKRLRMLWVQRGLLEGGELFKAWGKRGTAKTLYLVECNLDKEATKALASLTTLEELKVFQRCVTSSELSDSISELVNLKSLVIPFSEDLSIAEQCKQLANLKGLERLELHGPMMSVEGLDILRSLSKLNYLQFYGDLSREEIEQFRQNGPKSCRVRQFSRDAAGQVVDQYFQLP